MPPLPKPAGVRQRRNKASTARTLTLAHAVAAPALPELEAGWHPATVEWWADLWRSPMAPEFDSSDRHGLFMLARLVDAYWTAPSADAARQLAAEIRLQRQCYGLTPIDRRRLQWEIDRGDEAAERTAQRAARPKAARKGPDPRAALVV